MLLSSVLYLALYYMQVLDKKDFVDMMLFFFILGWLFKLKLTRPEELETLMDEKAYKKYCETLE